MAVDFTLAWTDGWHPLVKRMKVSIRMGIEVMAMGGFTLTGIIVIWYFIGQAMLLAFNLLLIRQ